uniref:Sema domain-containing protein n=1 Tax=Oncorhynchus mykiss TaxID=8022 RepID=A0A8L0DR18_ONCMY
MAWRWVLAAILATSSLSLLGSAYDEFTSDTLINNVVQDPITSRLYVGTVNALYQLDQSLHPEAHTRTGPELDNRQCTPPVTSCEEAVETDNHNKLLLIHPSKDTLIVCGSLYRGICSLRNLSNVEQLLYFSDTKGEKSYVASAEESVSVVGVMSYYFKDKGNFTVFLVAKGYGSHDSTKLISTRILQVHSDWVLFESIIEASAVQSNPFTLRYLHDFRHGFVYFLFSRTLGAQDSGTKNFTFISRMCENDHNYYSYTELQLNCSAGNKYNKVQAAYVTLPGEALAKNMSSSGWYGPVGAQDKRLVEIIGACYNNVSDIDSFPLQKGMVTNQKCGAEFLPSPLASRAEFALATDPVFTKKGLMTAVAVAVETEHAVAFLGTTLGEVLKLHLSTSPEVYGRAPGENTGDKVNKNLLFDTSLTHLYITTEKKVPVQACHLKTDCQSCVAQKDPYCGWCVVTGLFSSRCTRKGDCPRAEDDNTWLWSPNQQCVQIQAFNPPNLSCRKTDYLLFSLQADSCPQFENPDPHLIPVGYLIPISFQGKNLDIYKSLFDLFPLLSLLSLSSTSPPALLYLLSILLSPFYPLHSPPPPLSHSTFSLSLYPPPLPFLSPILPSPLSPLTLSSFSPSSSPLHLLVVLYNCSLGREDCSLCKNADPKYSCVWCANMRSCVYRELCRSQEPAQCPNPKITEIIPRFGPLNGGIVVTIKGSNLGIKKEDIKKVTVAGVDCVHQGDRYSVSTRYSPINQGVVEVEVEGGRRGRSEVLFTYRDPIPEKVSPLKGPVAGGTVITISGKHLDTANKNDVIVTVGGTPCEHVNSELYVFVCDYRLLCETKHRHSVLPGMKYLSLSLYSISLCPPLQFIQYAVHKNDTVLLFDSPVVNRSSETQSFRAFLQLDNVIEELNSFEYHPDPFFNELTKNIITETSIIIVTGRGFSKAMTAEEAQAFVGDASCKVTILQDDKLFLEAPSTQPRARSKRQRRDTSSDPLDLTIKFGNGEWVVGSVNYERKYEVPLAIIIPAVIVPMLLFIAVSVYCYRRKSQQAEREYEKVKHQLDHLEESVRDRCKKEFTDLMIEMEDQTNDLSEARIPFLDYKTYTDRVFFLPSKDGDNDVMITGKLDIPEGRKVIVAQALNQFSNLLNSKTFLINFIKTLEGRPDFNARSRVYFASLLTVALHGKLEYYTDIMRSLLLELMEEYVHSKNPKLMLRRSETVVERMLCNWMSICLYQFLRDSAGEPLYKLFKAIKHQVEKGPVDAKMKKAKYTLNDTGLLGDDVEYCVLTLQVLVHGEGPDVTPVKVLNCDTISQVKEKIIEQVYRNLPYSQRPKVDSVALEWRPGSTGQILSDMDLTSQKEGRWKRLNTLAHYNVRDNATLVLSRVLHTHRQFHQNQDSHEEKNALLEDDKVFHLVRPADELDEVKSKRGSLKAKATTKAIAEIYLTRLLSVKGTLQQFVDDFFRSVLCSGAVVPPAVKYFFDFLDEQALKHDNVEEETVHIWKTNSLPMRFWVNILKNPHFIFDVHVTEVVDASLSVIAQTFMDACTKTEHKLSRESPSNKLLYAKEISTYKKMVDDYYKGIKQMVPVSDQDMNTHLAEVSREHTDTLNTQAALHQLYQYASKYYDGIIQSLDDDPAAQSKQLTLRLQQIAAALENKVTDL